MLSDLANRFRRLVDQLVHWGGQELAEAREKFEESIGVILKAWTSEERFSHHGKY